MAKKSYRDLAREKARELANITGRTPNTEYFSRVSKARSILKNVPEKILFPNGKPTDPLNYVIYGLETGRSQYNIQSFSQLNRDIKRELKRFSFLPESDIIQLESNRIQMEIDLKKTEALREKNRNNIYDDNGNLQYISPYEAGELYRQGLTYKGRIVDHNYYLELIKEWERNDKAYQFRVYDRT